MSGTIKNPNEIKKTLSTHRSFLDAQSDDKHFDIMNNLNRQSCVRILRQSGLPIILKAEAEKFIERNVLQDCGRVPPNCLKAFMIKTAQKMGLHRIIPYVKGMFKSKIGYDGYYLDGGKLFRVDLSDNFRDFA